MDSLLDDFLDVVDLFGTRAKVSNKIQKLGISGIYEQQSALSNCYTYTRYAIASCIGSPFFFPTSVSF